MRVIIVMGEPGTGKTTLVREVMKLTGPWQNYFTEFKLVPFHGNKNKCVILGKYEEGETFAGTDRMSMAVQPEAVKFLAECNEKGVQAILFEGDRLTNVSFLENCLDNYDTSIIYLDVSPESREARYVERGSNQSEQFIRGRVTKYANIMTNFQVMMAVEKFVHETPADTSRIAHIITKKLHGTDSLS
jgi:pantothenate kinase